MTTPPDSMAIPKPPSRILVNWARIAPFMPWLVLLVSLIVTLKMWQDARDEAERELRSDFKARVLETSRRIEQRMLDYEQVLPACADCLPLRGKSIAPSSVLSSPR